MMKIWEKNTSCVVKLKSIKEKKNLQKQKFLKGNPNRSFDKRIPVVRFFAFKCQGF